MKLLITGAAGFVGFHLSKALLEKDIEIIGMYFARKNWFFPKSVVIASI